MEHIILLLKESPIVSALLIITPIIGIAWKVFHALYVKPRDFRIALLRDDLGRLTGEIDKLKKDREPEFPHPSPLASQHKAQPTNLALAPAVLEEPVSVQASPAETALEPNEVNTPLTSLAEMVKQWKNPKLTELQKQAFEKEHLGKEVKWIVRIESIGAASHGSIGATIVDVSYEGQSIFGPSAVALFPERESTKLLALNTGDVVAVRGQVREFFIGPVIESAAVE